MASRLTLMLILAISVLVAGLWAAPANAGPVSLLGIDHDGGAPDINAGLIFANPGDMVTVSLVADVQDLKMLGAWGVNLRYSDLILDAVSCTAHSTSSGTAACNPDYSLQDARVSGADAGGISGVFNLMDVTFQVIGPAGHCALLQVSDDGLEFFDTGGMALETIHPFGSICINGTAGDIGIDHNGGAPDINAGPAQVAGGGDVTVALVTNLPPLGLKAWEVNISYDPGILDATGCVSHPSGVCNENFSPTMVRSVGADIGGLSGTVALSNFTFKGIGPVGSCSDLVITVGIFVTAVGPGAEPLIQYNPHVFNGRICVVERCADVTGDHRVRLADVLIIGLNVILRRYESRFDLNGEGRLDRVDIRIAVGQLGRTC